VSCTKSQFAANHSIHVLDAGQKGPLAESYAFAGLVARYTGMSDLGAGKRWSELIRLTGRFWTNAR
jgi:hypothetical protein